MGYSIFLYGIDIRGEFQFGVGVDNIIPIWCIFLYSIFLIVDPLYCTLVAGHSLHLYIILSNYHLHINYIL